MRRLGLWSGVLCLGVLLTACGGGGGSSSSCSTNICVPDVTLIPQAPAEHAITTAGLVVGTETTAFSSTGVALGKVISQSPAAGTAVAKGSAVNLVISAGPPITVPTVTGLPQANAVTAITAAGLIVGTVTTASDIVVPAGNVISQNPNAATIVALGVAVNIVVSSGPPTLVPDVTTTPHTQAAAQNAITAAGLIVGTVSLLTSNTVLPGNVISQNPSPGTPEQQGTSVDLVVSAAIVPAVTGLTKTAAESAITAAQLGVGNESLASSRTVPTAGTVISQSPAAQTAVFLGSTVTLVISSGPPHVSVPNVVGQTLASAQAEITAPTLLADDGLPAGLTVTVTQQSSTAVPAGNVISQSAGPSTPPVGINTAVNLVVSSTFIDLSATMTTVRQGHSATLLLNSDPTINGKILLTGGLATNTMDTAEVFDPASQTFNPLINAANGTNVTMNTPRFGHTATLLPNGQVLLTGGVTASSSIDTAEVYDPVANAFTALSGVTMVSARAGHTATLLLDGRVLLTGGYNGSTVYNTAEVYDPVANTFADLNATMTTARKGHTATLLTDGTVLLTGGSDDTNASLSTVEIYNPGTNTFTPLPGGVTMVSARSGHTATLIPNGQVLLTGGVNNSGYLNTAEVYDPVANTFTSLPPGTTMVSARAGHTATLILPTGPLLLTGGSNSSTLNTGEEYQP